MSHAIDDPDELHHLASVAFEHAMRSIQPKGPLLPFALTEGPDGTNLVRAVSDRLESMLSHTQWLVSQNSDAFRAVVAWDGYSNHSGRRMDAILVAAYERGAAGSVVFAQSYESKGFVKKRNDAYGTPVVIARGGAPLFS